MSKYVKHYASKREYPTRIIKNGQFEGTLSIGHMVAKRDIERKLGRPLHKNTKIKTRGGNWVFYEPKNLA